MRPLSWGLGASLAIGGICWALEMGMFLASCGFHVVFMWFSCGSFFLTVLTRKAVQCRFVDRDFPSDILSALNKIGTI